MSTSIETTRAVSRIRPSRSPALLFLSVFTLAAICGAFLLPRIPQHPAYNPVR